jgi:hypothetical protein
MVKMRAMTKSMTGKNDAMEERRGERGTGPRARGKQATPSLQAPGTQLPHDAGAKSRSTTMRLNPTARYTRKYDDATNKNLSSQLPFLATPKQGP